MGKISFEVNTNRWRTWISFIDLRGELSVEGVIKELMGKKRKHCHSRLVTAAKDMVSKKGCCIEMWTDWMMDTLEKKEYGGRPWFFETVEGAKAAGWERGRSFNGRWGFFVAPTTQWSEDGKRQSGWTWYEGKYCVKTTRRYMGRSLEEWKTILANNPTGLHTAELKVGELKDVFAVWNKRGVAGHEKYIGVPTKLAREVEAAQTGEMVDIAGFCQMVVKADEVRRKEMRK